MLTTCDISRGICCTGLSEGRGSWVFWREEGQCSCGKPTCCSHPCQIEANEGQTDPWMQALSKWSLFEYIRVPQQRCASLQRRHRYVLSCGLTRPVKIAVTVFDHAVHHPTRFQFVLQRYCCSAGEELLTVIVSILVALQNSLIVNGKYECCVISQCKWAISNFSPPS